MKGKLMIMLLLIGSILFGAPVIRDSKSFNIELTINPVHEVKILEAVPTNVGAFNLATTITNHGFTESATTVSTYYMVVKTNNKSAVNIDVVVENMKSTGIDTQIAYTISAGAIDITSADTAVTGTLFTEVIPLASNGMRIVSQPFTIALDDSNVNDATSATYTSDIIFKLMAP
jgi:hypothetical protein